MHFNSAHEETHAGGGGGETWLVCRSGARLCALSLAHVHEVMRPPPIEVLAGAPRFVLGVCVLRGEPVPVVHAGLMLGEEPAGFALLVRLRAGGRTVALAVDAVAGIRSGVTGTLESMPPLLRTAAADTVAAIRLLDRELLYVLNEARVVPAAVFGLLEAAGGDR